MPTRSSLPAAPHGEAEEELDPPLQDLVEWLREALTPDQRDLFLALAERDLHELTSALNAELTRTPAPPPRVGRLGARISADLSALHRPVCA